MANDLTLSPDPDAPQTLSEGIPVSDIPQTDFTPLEISGIETVQGPVLEEREAAQKQFVTEQMATVGIEPPPEPPPDIDRFLFNEIVPPRADVLPQVHDSRPPTEAEARWAANKITPLATDEEVAVAEHTVRRFLESQQDDERAAQIEWAQSYYTDANKYKQLAEHPDVKLGIELSPDPELFQQTSVNNAWLNANMGRKLSAPELEIARKHIGKQLFNIPEISNQQFFSKMQEWSKGQAAEKELADSLDAAVGAHVLSDQLNRTYTPDYQVLEKLKKENPDVITPENERKFSLLNQRMHGRMRQLGESVREPYAQIFGLLQKTSQEKRDPTPDELTTIVDSLRAIDPENRKAMWGMVGRAARAGVIDAKGLAQFTENMSKGWAREFNLSDRTERDRETQIDDMRLQLDAGATFGMKDGRLVYAPSGQPLTPGAIELTPAEYADYRQKLDQAFDTIGLAREAQEAYETIVDPIRPIFKEGLLSAGERGLYALPAMGKLMIGGAIPGFGPILTFDAIQADIYRRTRLENPDMPVKDVARMATISAALQTIPEQIQIGLPLGKFGKLLEVDRDLTKSGFWAGAAVITKKAVKGTAAEFMMENFQDAVDMFYPAIQSQFDPNMKRQDVGEVAWQWLSTRPEVFAAVLIPGSVAAGVHTYKDLKNPIRSVFNSDVLRGMGIREDGIERILSKGTFEEMQAQLRSENATVTPEDRARGHDYISATAATTAARQSAVQTPSYRVVTQKDGTKVFEVLDAAGTVVFSNADEDLAQAAYADTVTAFITERLAAQEAAAATEEGQAATAEAEEALRTLTPESRTSAAHVLEFEDEQQPDAGVAAATARLETALAADPRSGGKPVKLIVQTRRLGPATLSAQRLNEAITGLERLFGKNVVFVRSGTGEDLPFTGIVNPADPNTIFLDAAGDRNVLAVIGHEWAHTLKVSNPQLHGEMVAQMRPLVKDWLAQEAKLRGEEGYAKITDEQLTDELVSNIFGDAFTRPDFLAVLHARNPSLFERVVKAIEEFFNSLIAAARSSEWATEGFITDLEAMHGVIADTIYEARTAGPEVTTAPAAAPLGFQKGQQVTYPGKRSGVTISATVVSELPNGQIRVEATLPGGGTTIADVDAPDLTPVAPAAVPAEGGLMFATTGPLYHGTPSGGFREFSHQGLRDSGWLGRGFYFTGDEKIAKMFTAKRMADKGVSRPKGRQQIYTVNLLAENLFDVDDLVKIEPDQIRNTVDARRQQRGLEPISDTKWEGYAQDFVKARSEAGNNQILLAKSFNDLFGDLGSFVQDWGFDGIKASRVEGGTYVVFDPKKIQILKQEPPELQFATRRGKAAHNPVVYHSTNNETIEQSGVEKGAYFFSSWPHQVQSGKKNNFAVQLHVNNPYQMEGPALKGEKFEVVTPELVDRLKAQGFDSIRRGANEWVVFNKNQFEIIKSSPTEFKHPVQPPDLQFATRRGKAAQARAEGISREESVAAAFERMHAAPGERLGLLERIKREYARVRAENAAAEAAVGTEEGAVSEMRRVHAFAELNALVKALPPEIRGRVGGALTLAKARTTELSLTDFLVKRIAMIDRELERVLRQEYQGRIRELLARFKPKRAPSGVVKGRIGADAQDVVNRVAAYTKMDGAAVQRDIDAIENTLTAGGLTPEEESALIIKQNELATFGAIDEMSAAELDAAHTELRSTIATGRASWGVTEEARLNDMRAKAAEVVSILPEATPPGVAKSNRAKFTNWLRNFARNHTSFIQVLDRLFPGASFISDWQSKAVARDSADQDYVRQTQQRLVDAIGAALGTKSTIRIGGALEKMGKADIPVLGGMASQRDAIQYLFAWGQPAVQERMRGQGWTDEHINTMQRATADPVSQALAAFFRQEYEAIYQSANIVYRRIYGMDLPRIEGTYAPMRYHGAGGPVEMTPTGAVVSSGVTPSAVKARVAHNARLRQVDSLQVFTEHLYQMSHWIHFAELIRETRGVLNNADVKLALEQSIGADGAIDLQNHLDSITRNGVTRSSEMKGLSTLATHITKGVAVGAMSFNLHSAAVQGDSGLRWMTAIPMQRWGNALLLHRWLPNIAKAWHSDTVQRRVKQGASPAIRTAMEQSNLTPSLLLRAVDIGFWPINMFDGALTSLSSAIVYTDAIQQGMTNEQAMQKMDEAIARFSQPIGITAKTQALATTGPLGRSLLLFMADPMLKTSLSMEGLMNISRGIRAKDISLIEKGFRSIVAVEIWSLVSQMILNAWAHYAGDDEEEDEYWLFKHWERAMLLAPIQGFFVAGDVADGLARAFFGEKWYEKQVPLFRFARDVQTTVTHWEDLLDPSSADFQKELSRVIKLGGTAVGSGWAAAASAIQRAVALKEKMEEK
jgi:ADP-Ribosyltransferase in polyvalent proteins